MIFDVGVRTNIRKAAYFRVNDRELSAFVRKVQDDGNYVFSVIPLFRSKLKDVVMKHTIDNMTNKDFEVLDKAFEDHAIPGVSVSIAGWHEVSNDYNHNG